VKQEGVEELLPEGWQLVADELSEHANFLLHVFPVGTVAQEALRRGLETVARDGCRRVEQQL